MDQVHQRHEPESDMSQTARDSEDRLVRQYQEARDRYMEQYGDRLVR